MSDDDYVEVDLEFAVAQCDKFLGLIPVAIALVENGAVALCRNPRPLYPQAPYSTHFVGRRSVESGLYDLNFDKAWEDLNHRIERYKVS